MKQQVLRRKRDLISAAPASSGLDPTWLAGATSDQLGETFRRITTLPPGGTETVLLVEDETAVRQLARRVLEGAGYHVLEASGPQEAIGVARVTRVPIHLLLSDVVMPGGGDIVLYEALRADRPALRVLYMSGYADETMVQRGWLAGDKPYLPKPFTAHELTQKVREVLDQ